VGAWSFGIDDLTTAIQAASGNDLDLAIGGTIALVRAAGSRRLYLLLRA